MSGRVSAFDRAVLVNLAHGRAMGAKHRNYGRFPFAFRDASKADPKTAAALHRLKEAGLVWGLRFREEGTVFTRWVGCRVTDEGRAYLRKSAPSCGGGGRPIPSPVGPGGPEAENFQGDAAGGAKNIIQDQ